MMRWKNGLAAVHRYLGIGFCLLFAMWFASGIVMLFQPYPALTESDRFACLVPLDPLRKWHALNGLVEAAPSDVARLRLTAAGQRPVLHRLKADGAIQSYWADTGDGPIAFDTNQARLAAAQCGFGHPTAVLGIYDDQWTVYQGFDAHRPIYKVPLDDEAGTVLYVSSHTGEVIQRTTRAARAWNWIGSVPHWIYFTAIRRDWAFWDALVWWMAGAGSIGALTGILIGVVRWRRSPASRISPFWGALYWHHLTGLGLGVVILAWILSGMLSMDHGRMFSTGTPTTAQVDIVSGTARFAGDPQALGAFSGMQYSVKEIEWARAANRAYVIFRHAPDQQAIVSAEAATSVRTLDPSLFIDAAQKLIPGARPIEHKVLYAYDTHYYGRTHAPRPLPVLRLRYDDAAATWFHIDLSNGAILDRLDASRRAYRYWFNALHSHDLPWMLDRMNLRQSWMTALCLAGFLFSGNGVWLAWKRLRRR